MNETITLIGNEIKVQCTCWFHLVILNILENMLIFSAQGPRWLLNIPAISTAHESRNREWILETKGLLHIHRILKMIPLIHFCRKSKDQVRSVLKIKNLLV